MVFTVFFMIGKEGLAYAHHLAFHGFSLILECKLLWDAFQGIVGWDTLVFSLDIRCTSTCHENTFCPQLTFAELMQGPGGAEGNSHRGDPSPQGGVALQWLRPRARGHP